MSVFVKQRLYTFATNSIICGHFIEESETRTFSNTKSKVLHFAASSAAAISYVPYTIRRSSELGAHQNA